MFKLPFKVQRNFLNAAQIKKLELELEDYKVLGAEVKDLDLSEVMGGIETDYTSYDISILKSMQKEVDKLVPNLIPYSYWTSESPKNTSVISHNHINPFSPAVILSVVFYIEGSGNEIMYLENPDTFSKLIGQGYYKINPEVGTLLIFPGWVNHHVETSLTSTRKCFVVDFVNK